MASIENTIQGESHGAAELRCGTEHVLARHDLADLYRRAFAQYRTRALWNIEEVADPTVEQALAITRQLRTEGDLKARRLAEQIEQAARAHL